MKKILLIVFLFLMFATFKNHVYASLQEELTKEGDDRPKVTVVSVDEFKTLQDQYKELEKRFQTMELSHEEFKRTIVVFDQLLKSNPGHRRIQRVGLAIWLPCSISAAYYLYSGDLGTSMSIASYGMSALFLLLSVSYKFDDSFFPVKEKKK